MKSKVLIMILAAIAVVSLPSCRGRAAVKTVEVAEKVLQKTPKKTTTTTLPASSKILESGKYADDAAKIVDEINEDDTYDSDDDY